ncbi:MAG TPA: DUF1634 domain-containing protein [Vicinamibacterales bacterium]|nr:DUF1634 domain-containing protein [Vicinamibacterales bacterium]
MRTPDQSLDRLERKLGWVLHAGVLSAALCLAFGLVAWMASGTTTLSNGALTLGLLVLMATPIMRVLVSLVAYVRMRDWFFVLTTIVVFVLLGVTVTLAWMKLKAG